MLTECPCCKKQGKVEEHRRLTQYSNSGDNYITCCKDCKVVDDEHWKWMWTDYYESQGYGLCEEV